MLELTSLSQCGQNEFLKLHNFLYNPTEFPITKFNISQHWASDIVTALCEVIQCKQTIRLESNKTQNPSVVTKPNSTTSIGERRKAFEWHFLDLTKPKQQPPQPGQITLTLYELVKEYYKSLDIDIQNNKNEQLEATKKLAEEKTRANEVKEQKTEQKTEKKTENKTEKNVPKTTEKKEEPAKKVSAEKRKTEIAKPPKEVPKKVEEKILEEKKKEEPVDKYAVFEAMMITAKLNDEIRETTLDAFLEVYPTNFPHQNTQKGKDGSGLMLNQIRKKSSLEHITDLSTAKKEVKEFRDKIKQKLESNKKKLDKCVEMEDVMRNRTFGTPKFPTKAEHEMLLRYKKLLPQVDDILYSGKANSLILEMGVTSKEVASLEGDEVDRCMVYSIGDYLRVCNQESRIDAQIEKVNEMMKAESAQLKQDFCSIRVSEVIEEMEEKIMLASRPLPVDLGKYEVKWS
ncbi:hypothetical protein EIN_119800 [Entamoeba invadens IP1]|uniref:Uncharacterized protein n=1 Tax=Entamoeba invadens IP1 TaxID=370355 RepID=L7FNU5_ENTIV|nr:hypothetical protein EIN_119800 [Entamoeba invadens IP1]ELP92296.1 hypothetical protein EIN_119800 [Entamoeba invadens IP1]|eukprot:XP_004259067.1 hypothetical protein EIN_119800 [Entamoeba invadens IP1]